MDEKCIDEAALAALHDLGGEELVGQMIDSFLNYAPRVMAEARNSLAKGDLEPVVRLGHTLRSSGRNLGAVRIAELAQNLEAAARAGQLASLSAFLDQMDQAFVQAKDCLEAKKARLLK